MDSNHRTRKGADLQSDAFGHFANPPGLKKWLGTESNRRHEDFQSSALPTELPSQGIVAKKIKCRVNPFPLYTWNMCFINISQKLNGGTDGIRTRDLLRDRQAC
ncbi:hypothetical protein TCA2_5335 [Paenibacillus sp. TCA20]|nr:hypothetical protein TCA2_5335 [Paenibacillus sp. TCA20]